MIELHKQILKLLSEGASYDFISYQLGIDRDKVADRVRNAQLARLKEIAPTAATVDLERPPSIPRKRVGTVRIDGRNIAVIGDTEMPDHSLEFMENVVEMSQLFGIDTLLIAGDGVALDQETLTSWAKEYYIQVEEGLPTIIDLAEALILWLLKTFKKVYWSRGNHDDRLAKALKGQVNIGMLLNRLPQDRFEFIDRRFLILDTDRGPCWVIHPNGGGNPASVMERWINTHPEKGHCLLPHFHVQVDTTTADGLWELHAIGTGRDVEKTEYLQMNIWRGRQWDASYMLIKDSYFYPMNLRNTDFAFWRSLLRGNKVSTDNK